jgi:hypothetical protein
VHDDNDNKRPDLLLINPPGFNKQRVAIDVSMTHCIPKTTTRSQAHNFNNDSISSKLAQKGKIKKFSSVCELAGIGFYALIFESTGKPSDELEKFLSRVMANSIEAKGMNPEATLRYWMTAISVNIQINIANAILNRAININSSRLNKLYHKDSCPDHILLSNSINGSQLTGSQHINDVYDDMHYEFDNDSEDESLFIPTPPSDYDSSNSNTQHSNNCLSMSSPTQPSPPFHNLSPPFSNSHELSHPTTPISPPPPNLSFQCHDLLSQQSSSDAHIKRSRYDITSPQSPSTIQIVKKMKLHTQLSTPSPNNTINLDYVLNTDNENNTYIC